MPKMFNYLPYAPHYDAAVWLKLLHHYACMLVAVAAAAMAVAMTTVAAHLKKSRKNYG